MNKPAAGGNFLEIMMISTTENALRTVCMIQNISFFGLRPVFIKIKSNNVMSYFVFFELNNGVDFSSSF